MNDYIADFEKKIILAKDFNIIKKSRTLVFTNGCFDIIHRGHVTYLSQAKNLGEFLVVALNTDSSVRKLGKGQARPINTLIDRMAVVASLEMVDYVVSFDEETPLNLIMEFKPDILVKGGDWQIDNIVGAKEVLINGGIVRSIPFIYNTSTTQVIEKINHLVRGVK